MLYSKSVMTLVFFSNDFYHKKKYINTPSSIFSSSTKKIILLKKMLAYTLLFIIGCSIGISARLYASDTLSNGGTLYQEDFLRSTNEAYYAIMQRDGNFVIYISTDFSPVNAQWSSNSTEKGQPSYRLVLQKTMAI